jgi:hypothetical protein
MKNSFLPSFPDFTNLAFWNQMFQNFSGLTVFVSWIKIFKYISFNKTMSQLSGTLTQVKNYILM